MSLARTIKAKLPEERPYPYRNPTPTNVSQCITFMWYLANRHTELTPLDGGTQLLFEDGRAQEKWMIDICQKYGQVTIINNNERISCLLGRHQISSRPDGLVVKEPDGLIEGLEEGKLPMIEYKAMNSFAFQQFRYLGLREAAPYYYDQVQLTLLACRATWTTLDIPYAILFAKNKETADIHDEVIKLDDGAISDLEISLDEREVTFQQDAPPPRPYERGSRRCDTCAARLLCWSIPPKPHSVHVNTLSNEKELRELAKSFIDLVRKERDTKKAIASIQKYFDNTLKEQNATELIIPLDPGTSVVPHFRIIKDQVYIDEEVLIRDFPEVTAKVARTKDTTQFRQKITVDGQLIRQ